MTNVLTISILFFSVKKHAKKEKSKRRLIFYNKHLDKLKLQKINKVMLEQKRL